MCSIAIIRTLDTPTPSKFAESALPQVEFKVDLCIDQDTSELAAVVCRARMRASQLQPSFGLVRQVSFSQVQSASDVNRDIMENTWRPFLENIAKFAEVAKPIVEVRSTPHRGPSGEFNLSCGILSCIHTPRLRVVSWLFHTRCVPFDYALTPFTYAERVLPLLDYHGSASTRYQYPLPRRYVGRYLCLRARS